MVVALANEDKFPGVLKPQGAEDGLGIGEYWVDRCGFWSLHVKRGADGFNHFLAVPTGASELACAASVVRL